MKKFSIILLSFFMLSGLSATDIRAAEDNFCTQFKNVKKIWWDGIELKSGQIGRLTIVKDTSLFKLEGEKKTFSRTLKAGEFYRIYAFKPGMLSVGGGYFVDRDNKVTYQTPSKTKLNAVKCINSPTKPKPTSSEKQNDHGEISDGLNSVTRFMGTPNGFLAYDKETKKHDHIPYKLNTAGLYTHTSDAIYVNVYDENANRSTMNSHQFYKVDLKKPYNLTKVLDEHVAYATTDGQNIYYSKEVVEGNTWTLEIYKTDLLGNGKVLLKRIEGGYNPYFTVNNGSLYTSIFNFVDGAEIVQTSLNGAEEKVIGEVKSSDYDSTESREGYFFHTSSKDRTDYFVFDPKTNQSFNIVGPAVHDYTIYNHKFYYTSGNNNNELYILNSQGKAEKILTSSAGSIIGFSSNYVICYNSETDKITELKFTN
ncbi:DUF5050 domain-containing protein [Cytobacillus sp. FJAT-54145]|uniref:DUF5050 domain-containing protein n=1 Tax=Cytobacillus spartinae TaxID=3299023 RepID=A0ABW6KDZ7_9BACI